MNETDPNTGIEDRIQKQDHEAIFTRGCCYHFALRVFKTCEAAGVPVEIHGIPSGDGWSHVWCFKISEKIGIDIHGGYPEELLARLAATRNPEIVGSPIESIGVLQIEATIKAKGWPPELDAKIFALADKLFSTHERFGKHKPHDPGLYEKFLKDRAGNMC